MGFIRFFIRRFFFKDVFFPTVPLDQSENTPCLNSNSISHDFTRYILNSCGESEGIKLLRDKELQFPAPFGNKVFVARDNRQNNALTHMEFAKYESEGYIRKYRDNVPIMNIIGGGTSNNLDNYSTGLTYREILFQCLHGIGVTRESLNFLLGHENKSQEMPHNPSALFPKSYSKLDLSLTKYGDYYISSNGHQRAIMAMFWIYQNEGVNGTLKNVLVKEWVIKY